MNPSGCLEGRVVVTGASQRLGVAFARVVHEAGQQSSSLPAARTVSRPSPRSSGTVARWQ
jgi:short-subunit dehydrogenase